MADYTTVIKRDAENKQLTLTVLDAAGAAVATYGSVTLKIDLLEGGTPANPGHAMGKEITLRETKGCDADGNPVYCILLRSEWYETPLTSNPET